jgi:hypothetical protein
MATRHHRRSRRQPGPAATVSGSPLPPDPLPDPDDRGSPLPPHPHPDPSGSPLPPDDRLARQASDD